MRKREQSTHKREVTLSDGNLQRWASKLSAFDLSREQQKVFCYRGDEFSILFLV